MIANSKTILRMKLIDDNQKPIHIDLTNAKAGLNKQLVQTVADQILGAHILRNKEHDVVAYKGAIYITTETKELE